MIYSDMVLGDRLCSYVGEKTDPKMIWTSLIKRGKAKHLAEITRNITEDLLFPWPCSLLDLVNLSRELFAKNTDLQVFGPTMAFCKHIFLFDQMSVWVVFRPRDDSILF